MGLYAQPATPKTEDFPLPLGPMSAVTGNSKVMSSPENPLIRWILALYVTVHWDYVDNNNSC